MSEQALEVKAPKKGKKSWTPSNLDDLKNKEAGYRYRWVQNDPDNIAKKQAEGWEFVQGTSTPKTKIDPMSNRLDDGKQLTTNVTRRDAVAMRLDENTALSRDEYHNQKVERLEKRIFSGTKKDLGKEGAAMHGSLTKERKGVRTVIE